MHLSLPISIYLFIYTVINLSNCRFFFLSVGLSIQLSICLCCYLLCLYVYQSVCRFEDMSFSLYNYLYVCWNNYYTDSITIFLYNVSIYFYLFIDLPVRQFIYFFVCWFIYVFICLYICLSICASISIFICLSACLCMCFCVPFSFSLYAYMSFYLSINISIYFLFSYLPVYLPADISIKIILQTANFNDSQIRFTYLIHIFEFIC